MGGCTNTHTQLHIYTHTNTPPLSHRHTNTHARTHTLTIIHEHMIGVKDVSHVEMCTFVDGEVEQVHSFKGVST